MEDVTPITALEVVEYLGKPAYVMGRRGPFYLAGEREPIYSLKRRVPDFSNPYDRLPDYNNVPESKLTFASKVLEFPA